MTPERIWADYCAATGEVGSLPDVDAFGDDPAMQDELLALVMAGTKRATCALARDFGPGNAPKPGDHWIITDGVGAARCIVRTTSVTPTPIRSVTAEFAAIEGEGDGSLAYWKRVHEAYYRRQGEREGFTYDDSMIGLCEVFECVWPPKDER